MPLGRKIQQLVKRDGEKSAPFAAMGVSMGGGLAITASIMDPTAFDTVVLVSPMCGVANGLRPHWIIEKLFRIVAKWFPTLPLTPVPNIGRLCYRDPKVYDVHLRDNRLCFFAKPRLGTAMSMLAAQECIGQNAHQLKTPFVLFHGDSDPVTAPESSLTFFNAATGAQKQIEIIKGQDHVLIGPDADKASNDYVSKTLISWITQNSK